MPFHHVFGPVCLLDAALLLALPLPHRHTGLKVMRVVTTDSSTQVCGCAWARNPCRALECESGPLPHPVRTETPLTPCRC